MARSKSSGRTGHPDMFVGRLVKGKPSTVKMDLGDATTSRIVPVPK
jgi:hypothetical protein